MVLGPVEITVNWVGWRRPQWTQRRLNADIRALCAKELRIAAIKLHRERTGSLLKDAKDYVDRLCPYDYHR